jgi:4-diphosphocytidyl-2-C-methyl-D-erythritol kinase
MRLKLKSHAKINLILEVLYRRQDGYHQLRTILQELELHDTLYLEDISGGKLELICDNPSLPSGKGNLAFRAAQLMQSAYATGRGVRIHLKKRIPVAAGLGGGSSNAAAVLKGLNRLWGIFLHDDDLRKLGSLLGSDVPFFISGGTALAGGRGEIIQPLPLFPQIKVLLAAVHGAKLSAAEVYSALDLEKISSMTKIEQFIRLLEENSEGAGAGAGKDYFKELASLIQNHLEPPVFYLHKGTALLKEKLLQKGLAAMVSGSGPTLFVLSRDDQLLYKLEKELSREGCWTIITETIAGKGDIIGYNRDRKKMEDSDC